ncbi:transporter substrate-binding domain-containing protein [Francisellaceae bacterium]|nr:transporter substrate-binding domain-containing protein [Francisellaceae bacterium]
MPILLFLFSIFSITAQAHSKPQQVKTTHSKNLITACAEPWAPYDYIEMGQPTGIDTKIISQVLTQLNVDFKILIVPWKICWAMLKSGKADMGLMVAKDKKRMPYVSYSEIPVLKANYVFFTNQKTKQEHDLKNCADLRKANLKIGLVANNVYDPRLWKCLGQKPDTHNHKPDKHKEDKVVIDKTLEFSLKQLSWGGIQIAPVIKKIGLYSGKELGIKDLDFYPWTVYSKNFYATFSKKSHFKTRHYKNIQDFQKDFDQALSKFKKTAEFKKLIE